MILGLIFTKNCKFPYSCYSLKMGMKYNIRQGRVFIKFWTSIFIWSSKTQVLNFSYFCEKVYHQSWQKSLLKARIFILMVWVGDNSQSRGGGFPKPKRDGSNPILSPRPPMTTAVRLLCQGSTTTGNCTSHALIISILPRLWQKMMTNWRIKNPFLK